MPKKIAKLLQAGDRVRHEETGAVIELTHVGRGIDFRILFIEWNDGGGPKYAYVSPHQEFEVLSTRNKVKPEVARRAEREALARRPFLISSGLGFFSSRPERQNMRRKPARNLQAGDKVRRGREVVTLTYAGRAAIRGVVLIQWTGTPGDNWAHVPPDKELEVL
jgi:hypothetical protein